MKDGSEQPKLWTAGDWDAYFGVGTSSLMNLIGVTGRLRLVLVGNR